MNGTSERYFCCDEHRRRLVRAHPSLNGIDYLEVSPEQTSLEVRLLKPMAAAALAGIDARIEGGERIRNVRVLGLQAGVEPDRLELRVAEPGDFSTYRLRLLGAGTAAPPAGFDPLLSSLDFSFKAACPSDFDCKSDTRCPPEVGEQPVINYLAKDYESFRRLMLDRLSLIAPDWRERSPGDLGVALVELLAYVGDHLSYRQDAVATEAYLGTARRRVSIRRHARLVDYRMHDGCNARVFVHFAVDAAVELPARTQLATSQGELPTWLTPPDLSRAVGLGAAVFETCHSALLHPALNEIRFHTWGDERCCLAVGAVRATLRNPGYRLGSADAPGLQPGEFLIFEEVRGPETARAVDADPGHRHVVRLTEVTFSHDLLFADPPLADVADPDSADDVLSAGDDRPLPAIEIAWAAEDALPFPLCLWRVEDEREPGRRRPVSVARGNVVFADHGRSLEAEPLGTVPAPHLDFASNPGDPCEVRESIPLPPRFYPQLSEAPLTFAEPHVSDPERPSAAALMRSDPVRAVPQVTVAGSAEVADGRWMPLPDLLSSRPDDMNFVVETETDGRAFLRFGDGVHGARPPSGTSFFASYRVGNGRSGNVGAEAIAHVVTGNRAIRQVRNPLPATGATDPETLESVRQAAPVAFRRQERAVTLDDHSEVAERFPQIQRAVATRRWTGSWYTTFVTADRLGGLPFDDPFQQRFRGHLDLFRLAGHDLEIDEPIYVPLRIMAAVCVLPHYFRSDVARVLADVFSSGCREDGTCGFFHPDNLTFGQPVYLSQIYAAAQAVTGVSSVEVTRFERLHAPGRIGLDLGRLDMARLEIARVESDPNFAERGSIAFTLAGGR